MHCCTSRSEIAARTRQYTHMCVSAPRGSPLCVCVYARASGSLLCVADSCGVSQLHMVFESMSSLAAHVCYTASRCLSHAFILAGVALVPLSAAPQAKGQQQTLLAHSLCSCLEPRCLCWATAPLAEPSEWLPPHTHAEVLLYTSHTGASLTCKRGTGSASYISTSGQVCNTALRAHTPPPAHPGSDLNDTAA